MVIRFETAPEAKEIRRPGLNTYVTAPPTAGANHWGILLTGFGMAMAAHAKFSEPGPLRAIAGTCIDLHRCRITPRHAKYNKPLIAATLSPLALDSALISVSAGIGVKSIKRRHHAAAGSDYAIASKVTRRPTVAVPNCGKRRPVCQHLGKTRSRFPSSTVAHHYAP
jgi:hypothetical protein